MDIRENDPKINEDIEKENDLSDDDSSSEISETDGQYIESVDDAYEDNDNDNNEEEQDEDEDVVDDMDENYDNAMLDELESIDNNNDDDLLDDLENNDDYDIDNQKIENYISSVDLEKLHPEIKSANFDEVYASSRVIRDEHGSIVDPLHKTPPFITKYEKARVIGTRTEQLEAGALPYIELNNNIVNGRTIALMEYEQKKIPFIIARPLPNKAIEYWRLEDLEYL